MSLAPRLTGVAAALCLVPALAQAQRTATPAVKAAASAAPVEGPLKHAPKPTTAAITPADLMTRLYIFADDSMLGREAGTLGGIKGTDYIAREAKRLGLEPAGDAGTYFQNVPMGVTRLDTSTVVGVKSRTPFARGTDYIMLPASAATPFGGVRELDGVVAVYGGRLGDTTTMLPAAQGAGRLVVLDLPRTANGGRDPRFWMHAATYARFKDAAGIAVAGLDAVPPQIINYFSQESLTLGEDSVRSGVAVGMVISPTAAQQLLGTPLDSAKVGAAGATLAGRVRFVRATTPHPARNVVAIVRGSDPALRGTYVVIGSHNDHDGLAAERVDHDSVKVWNRLLRPTGAEGSPRAATPDELARLRASLDSVRKLRPARVDSVMNGADDDGSGSMAMLEIAEAMALSRTKPKRSVLFVWHTAEEKGLFGSEWYADHPTVPRDSIVAGINIDMIGRGGAGDLAGGGPNYLQLIGSRRLSTQFGDLVESVNKARKFDFAFDYQYDANGHPQQYYCRSDHYNYARYGIPVVFASTGGHQDYHILTDEPQYINYPHFTKVTRFLHELTLEAANLAQRPVVDKEKPDPRGQCRQ